VHVIASNPPYIEADDPHLQQGDLRYEPPAALTDFADGLAHIRHIAQHAPAYLRRHGWLLLEHGATTGAAVRVKRRDAPDPQEKRRADAYYWQDVCGWLNGQPEKERVLAAGGWDVLVGAADFPMAQDKIG